MSSPRAANDLSDGTGPAITGFEIGSNLGGMAGIRTHDGELPSELWSTMSALAGEGVWDE